MGLGRTRTTVTGMVAGVVLAATVVVVAPAGGAGAVPPARRVSPSSAAPGPDEVHQVLADLEEELNAATGGGVAAEVDVAEEAPAQASPSVAQGAAPPPPAGFDPATCTHTWNGIAGDGLWQSSGNWSPDDVPGADSVACIDGADVRVAAGPSVAVGGLGLGGGTLAIGSGAHLDIEGAATVEGLLVDGGTLGGTGEIVVVAPPGGRTFTWSSGTLTGSGDLVVQGLASSLTSGSLKVLSRPMVNEGELGWSAGPVRVDPGGSIRNEGTFSVSAAGQMDDAGQAGTPVILNRGTLDVTTAGTTALDGIVLDNRTDVSIASGATLRLGPGTHVNEGTVALAEGALLDVDGSYTQTGDGGLQVRVAGPATTEHGRVTVDGTATLEGALAVTTVAPFAAGSAAITLIDAATRSGTFTTFTGAGWALDYVGDDVVLGGPDIVPTTPVVLPQEVPEGIGTAQVVVQGAGGNAPTGVPVVAIPETATSPADYIPLAAAVVVPPNGTTTIPISIIADALDEDDETLTLLVGGASARITIVDDDPEPFVGIDQDPEVVEGDEGTTDLVFTLRLTDVLGDDAPSGRNVAVFASTNDGGGAQAALDHVDTASLVVIPAGQVTATFSVPVIGDEEDEDDETVAVGLAGPTNARLGTTATATGTIIDDDGELVVVDDVAGQLNAGSAAVASAVPGWGEAFDLDGFDLPALGLDPFELPVVTDDLASAFGTPAALGPVSSPFDEVDGEIAEVVADLEAAGVTVDWAEGGVGGTPAPPTDDDVLQARYVTTLGGLAEAAGFTGDGFNDDFDEVLAGLASALDLDADLDLSADLVLTVVFGIDVDGFYVASESGVRLDVTATGAITGEGDVAGVDGLAVDGGGTAEVSVALTATGGPDRLRTDDLGEDPYTLLRPSADGTAAMLLGVSVEPLDLTWGATIGVETDDDGNVAASLTAGLAGTLDLPGFRLGTSPDATPARIDFEGTFAGGTWTLEGEATIASDLEADGYAVRSLSGSAVVDPDSIAVDAELELEVGDGPTLVDAELSVDDEGWSGTATVERDELVVGPVRIDDPSITVTASHETASGDTSVAVALSASGGRVDGSAGPEGPPLVRVAGLGGSIDRDGRVCVDADSIDGTIGDALTFTATDVEVCSPGEDGIILRVDEVTAVAPDLGDLSVTITDLVLDAQGRFGADSVAVEQPDGIAQSVGLAGLVPVDITSLVLSFPQQDEEGRIEDLSSFVVALEGTVDVDAFDGLPFDPVVQLGGDVITPDSPEGEREISFSAQVQGVDPLVVRPLDLGPITLGFDDLRIGDYELSGQVSADGYVGGVLQPNVCLEAEVTGGFDTLDLEGGLEACGEITETPDGPVISLSATATASLAVRGGVEIEDLALTALLTSRFVDETIVVGGSLDSASVGRVTIPFGDFATAQVTDAVLRLTPEPGEPVLEVGGALGEAGSGAGLVFGEGVGPLAGWGGRMGRFGLDEDLTPLALDGFFAEVVVPDGEQFGLPEFLPFELERVGFSFPGSTDGQVEAGTEFTPALLDGLRLRVSGGLVGTPVFPISAGVDGLEVDIGRLLAFDPLAPIDLATFPITNLDGVSFGIEPALDLGGLSVSGGLSFGTVEAGGTSVLFGRIRGDVSTPAFQAGADIVVTQHGPVLLRVTAPLGVPLGPTGLVLRSVTGAATFGPGGTVTPPREGQPEDLLGELFDLPTDVEMGPAEIQAAVAPAVASGTPTWGEGFAIALQGDLTHVAAVGMIEGNVTLAAAFGAPEPGQPERVQLVGRGDISAFGIPLAEGLDVGGELAVAGILLDFGQPLAPSIDLAFQSPVSGSPLAVVFPAQALVAAQLRTDGVIEGVSAGLATFVEQAVSGSIDVGGDLFADAMDDLAADLQANRGWALSRLVLAPDDPREIDTALLQSRLLALLSDPGTAAQVAGPLLQAVGASVAQAIDDGGLGISAAEAADALYDVVADAAVDALLVADEAFDPSFTFRGALQPLLLGIPVGSPTTEVEVALDRRSLRFELTTSMIENLKVAARQIPGVGPFAEQLITLSTLGGRDALTFGVQVPVPDLVSILLQGGELDELDPADPGQGWSITVGGAYDLFGMEAQVTGIMTAPDNAAFVDTKVEKRWLSDGTTPPDPDRIQITRPEDYDNLIRYGGILLDGRLEVPRLLTDPVDVLSELPPIPDDALGIGQWLADGAAVIGQVETPLRLTVFAPGLTPLLEDPTEAAVEDWAEAFVVTGVFEGTRQTPTSDPVARLLSLPVGEGRLLATTAGLEVTANVPLLGVDGTFVLRVDERDGVPVPSGGLELTMSSAEAQQALADLGIPEVFDVDATASVRAFTPAFDPTSGDPLRRRGGLAVGATLDAEGFVDDAELELVVDPLGTGAGPDFTATASVGRIGPFAGNVIEDASITIAKVGTEVTVRVRGSAVFGGVDVTVDGQLEPDLTGTLTFTAAGPGPTTIGGLQFVSGGFALTLGRSDGELVGSIGIGGTVQLPSFLASRSGAATASASGCLGTDGALELRLGITNLTLGSNTTISGTGQALPIDPDAPCTLPPGTPPLSPNAARVVVRQTDDTTRVVFDGALRVAGSGLPALTVEGDLSTTGTGSLDVRFGSGLALSGFSVRGGATLSFTPTSFAIAVDGRITVPNLVTDATVRGSITNTGIQSLAIGVTGLSLPPLQISNASLTLAKQLNGSYLLTTSLTVTVPGVRRAGTSAPTVVASGTIATSGDFDLGITGTGFTVGGVGITSADLDLRKTGTTLRTDVSARFSLWSSSLTVTGDLTVAPGGVSGNVDLRTPGGPISLGGWAIGGDLELAFSLTSDPVGVRARVSLVDGTVTVPGIGTLTADADMATDGTGSISISTPSGIRLGGSSSPFLGFGTFRLSQVGGVVTFSGSGISVRHQPVGGTETFRVNAPTFSISSNGSFSIATQGATIGSSSGLRLVIPSATLAASASGLSLTFRMTAGSLVIPGLADGSSGKPVLATPQITISTGAFRFVVFEARTIDLGLLRLNGRLVFERTASGVFRLAVEGNASGPAHIDLGTMGRIDLGDFFVASDGSFSVQASTTRFGPTSPLFEIRDASITFRRSGSIVELAVTGGELRIPSLSQPIDLPNLSLRTTTDFTQAIALPALDLGPFFRTSSAAFTLRINRSGASFALDEPSGGGNNPSVTAFAGSTSMRLSSLSVTSGGTFSGSVTGRLSLFGTRISETTFDVRLASGVLELSLPSSRAATLNLGFVDLRVSGTARSDGFFTFTGSASTDGNVFGVVSWDGSVRVTVSSSGGVTGSYDGDVSFGGLSGGASGTMSSTGRVTGQLRVDLNFDRSTSGFQVCGPFGCSFVRERVDYAFDLDPTPSSPDTTAPTMAQPPNLSITTSQAFGSVPVSYTQPTASDSRDGTLNPRCSPGSGALFPVGQTTSVTCTARDAAGNTRTRTFTIQVSFVEGLVTLADGVLSAQLGGFGGRTPSSAFLFSDPVFLADATADGEGIVRYEIVLPTDLEPGAHHLVVVGTDPAGAERQWIVPVTVGPDGTVTSIRVDAAPPGPDEVPEPGDIPIGGGGRPLGGGGGLPTAAGGSSGAASALDPSLGAGSGSGSGGSGLARTGTDLALPVRWALMLLLLGVALLAVTRRRGGGASAAD